MHQPSVASPDNQHDWVNHGLTLTLVPVSRFEFANGLSLQTV